MPKKLFPIAKITLNSFMREVPIIRSQSNDLQSKSMDWFLYDRDLRFERVNQCEN